VVGREVVSDARETAAVEVVDARLGAGGLLRKALRYVFPEHWSFLLGEIALYAFAVLVLSGTYLALFFTPDTTGTLTYHGPFQTLQGMEVTRAYASTLDLSSSVPGGLMVRQTHHWAALVFVAAMVIHLMRVFFTGAFRRPREIIWTVGVLLLGLGIFEGFAGYSLPDDLLSGMGLAIAYSASMSLPLIGGELSALAWGGEYPGPGVIESRLFIAHVFVVPAVMAILIALHLALIARHHHTQFPGPGRREDNTVGTPMWPAYALRSLGLFAAVAAVLVLLGGLVQINPVWQWGPYEIDRSTNGAQPDWYLGWLIGALRLMPPLEVRLFGRTLVPNPFFGGVLFPTVVFGVLLAWPWLESRVSRAARVDRHLLDRPRDRPWRTAIGAAFFAWVFLIFLAGSADRLFLQFGISYEAQVHVFRALVFIVPVVVLVIAKASRDELRRTRAHPFRGGPPRVVTRLPDGRYAAWPADGEPAEPGPAVEPEPARPPPAPR
jgi:ubiquinol-cytochrome c reductase cytochrome b subunit